MAVTVEEFLVQWGFKVDDKKLDSIQKKTKKLNSTFKKMSVVSTGALVAVGTAAARLQGKIANASTMINQTGEGMAKTSAQMRQFSVSLANDLGLTAESVAGSFYQTLSTGAEPMTEEFKNLAREGNKFAKVAGMETAQAVELLSGTMQIFGKDSEETNQTASQLFRSTSLGQTNLSQLSQALKISGSTARAMGLSFERTNAMLIQLANAQLKGSEGGTALRQVLSRLRAPNDRAQEALNKMNVELYDMEGNALPITNILKQMRERFASLTEEERNQNARLIVGQEAMKGFFGLINSNIDDITRFENELGKSGNVLDEAYNKEMNAPLNKLKSFGASLTNLAAVIGDFIIKAGAPFIDVFIKATDAITEFIMRNKFIGIMIGSLMGLTAAASSLMFVLTGLVMILPSMMTAFGIINNLVLTMGLNMNLLGNTALLTWIEVGAGIAIVIAGLATIGFFIQDIITGIQGGKSVVFEGAKAFWVIIQELFKNLKYRIKGLWSFLKVKVRYLWQDFLNTSQEFIAKIINKIKTFVKDKAGFLGGLLFPDNNIGLSAAGAGNVNLSQAVPANESVYNQSRNEMRVDNINVSVPEGMGQQQATDMTREAIFGALEDYSREKERENPVKERY